MKSLDIAIKDLLRSFRSASALVFMFVVPLLVTTLFYFMFGSIFNQEGEGFDLPQTKVVIANLDQGDERLTQGAAGLEAGSSGEQIVQLLQSEQFADLMQVSQVVDAASARAAVDSQQAGVAVIIPEDFSSTFLQPEATSTIELYQDPTLTIGPRIVRSILSQFVDGFSGVKIAVATALKQDQAAGRQIDSAQIGEIIQAYVAASQPSQQDSQTLLQVQSPGEAASPANQVVQIVGPIMGGMMIFYAFFTGTATAQSIIKEEEDGTLPRLFTTPTPQSTILSGKFIAVGLTILVQVVTLLVVSNLVFGIQWGSFGAVFLTTIGVVASASTFGIFVVSLLKNSRQVGAVFGGLLTITGMLGMLPIFVGGSQNLPPALNTVSLLAPQGWAMRSLSQSLEGDPSSQVLLTFAVLMAISVLLFAIGVSRFKRRYSKE